MFMVFCPNSVQLDFLAKDLTQECVLLLVFKCHHSFSQQ
jgi:hypothetical protein